MSNLYYIQTKGFSGNCLLFWREKRQGYTCNLDDAGKYTEKEAKEIVLTRPKQDFMWRVELIDKQAVRHVTKIPIPLTLI